MRRLVVMLMAVALIGFVPATSQSAEFIFSGNDPTGISPDLKGDDKATVRVYTVDGSGTRHFFGQFNYRESVTTPTLDAEAGWRAGDRVAYACVWLPFEYRGYLGARVTYNNVVKPSTISITDEDMIEGFRHYDGTFDGPEDPKQFDAECTNPPSGDGVTSAGPTPPSYPDLPAGTTFPPTPPLVIEHGPHDLDIRNFQDLDDTTVPIDPTLRIRLEAQTARRVTYVGYERLSSGSWRARVEIHFDVLVPGVNVPGTAHPITLRTTLESGHEEPEPSPSPSPTC